MKKFKLFALAALAAFALPSCSSEDVVSPENGENMFAAGSVGYITVTINTPTENSGSSRANDDFNHGIAAEYFIDDATMLIFGGTNESTATFLQPFDIVKKVSGATDNSSTDPATQVTIELKFSAQLADQIKKENNLYAVMVVNKGNFNPSEKSDDVYVLAGKTIDEVMSTKIACDKLVDAKGHILMTNTIFSNKPGNATPTDAASSMAIDISKKIYKTADLANTNPVNFYVERAVSKVGVNVGSTFTTKDKGDGTKYNEIKVKKGTGTITYTVEVNGWVLANVSPTNYLGRKWGADSWLQLASEHYKTGKSKWRFQGETEVTTGLYRTYFGKSPSYDDNGIKDVKTFQTDNNAFEIKGVGVEPSEWKATGNALYCPENTFLVENMTVKNATHVIVKTTYKVSGTPSEFYTINDDRTIVYDADGIKAEILAALKQTNSAVFGSVAIENFVLEFSTSSAGINAVSKVLVESVDKSDAADLTSLNANNVIRKYAGGVVYYKIPIKHFGNDLTPWEESYATPGATIANSYGSDVSKRDNNYLGRYGLVRNNWYDIDIEQITGIGTATIPNIPNDDTPLDLVHTYIAAKINILSWAKRTQTEQLH